MTFSRRQFLLQTTAGLALLSSAKMRAFARAVEQVGLRDHFKEDFHIGTAIGSSMMDDMPDFFRELVSREFSAITMENDMKWEHIQPEENQWQWDIPDKFVKFGEEHNMYVVGHVLVWHSQTPDWVFQDSQGKPLGRRALLQRMRTQIEQMAGRYKGRVHAWDVVNEAVDGNDWRKSPWFNIIGPQFMEYAFHYARDVDPKAHLMYNDYNMHLPEKRELVVNLLKKYKKKGVPIQGVGMQGHVGLSFPDLREFEDSLIAYAAQGMRVHITEMDMDVLPVAWEHTGAEISTSFEYSDELNPYTEGLPAEIEQEFTDRYVAFFKLFLKHRDKIDRVTFWGTSDAESWKNNFPVVGRTNYPLLFDRQYQKKPVYQALVDLTK